MSSESGATRIPSLSGGLGAGGGPPLLGQLSEHGRDRLAGVSSHDDELHRRARALLGDAHAEGPSVGHRLLVELDDDVAAREPRLGRGAPLGYLAERTPRSTFTPSASAIEGVTSWIETPR
jgi:hypothetical protein